LVVLLGKLGPTRLVPALQARRGATVRLRDRGEISNDTLYRIGRDLDLEDSGCQI
jgi:hypothetical protein